MKIKRNKLGQFISLFGKDHPNWSEDLHTFITRPCMCGCGNSIRFPKSRPRRFVSGHNSKLDAKAREVVAIQNRETRVCICGCGKTFECDKSSKQKVLWGHNWVLRSPQERSLTGIKTAATRRKNRKTPLFTPLYKVIRESTQYKQWRTDVFIRDNYTCQKCGSRSGNGKRNDLQVHHKTPFALVYREAIQVLGSDDIRQKIMIHQPLFNIDNGVTYCRRCHYKIKHKHYNRHTSVKKKLYV